MACGRETAGAASSSVHYNSAVDAAHELRRQRSLPAATNAFALCGARGDHRSPIILGNGSGPCAPTALGGAGGVGSLARALWAWLARGRWKAMRRSGSSSAKEQYGHEDYAQNFDEGAAAAEPENLARSFSARYARRRLIVRRGSPRQSA